MKQQQKAKGKYFTSAFHSPELECRKAYELLRRVYNLIEMNHLNDSKLIPTYCEKIEFPRNLGDSIFNLLSSKDQVFRNTRIKQQKRWRRRQKNRK